MGCSWITPRRKRSNSSIAASPDGSLAFDDLVCDSKRLILQVAMSSELNVLARRLDHISEQHRWSRDFTLESLRDGLREVLAAFPVYRTYVRSDQSEVDAQDRRQVNIAIREAKLRNPAISESVFDFIQSVLLLEHPNGVDDAQRAERQLFAMRFQQLSSPVMAKGVEDTAFYRYYPLASLNEVGGDPARFGVSVNAFHRRNLIGRRVVAQQHERQLPRTTPSAAKTSGRASMCFRKRPGNGIGRFAVGGS